MCGWDGRVRAHACRATALAVESSTLGAVHQAVADAVRVIGNIRTELHDAHLLLLQLDAIVHEADLRALEVARSHACPP